MINSYVGPVFSRYLAHLGERFAAYPRLNDVLIMQSNGGVAPIEDSGRMAVRAILSGPAGGVSAAAYLGQLLDEPRIIAFDMGGTSTDISLIENGVPHIANEKFEAGWKIAAPMIDIHTLGAGGGSIARVDDGGILHVGPDSAGADPGPACYGKGGGDPTVTDASLALGYLDAGNFLGGRASLDASGRRAGPEPACRRPAGLSDAEAAFGVYKVVCTHRRGHKADVGATRGRPPGLHHDGVRGRVGPPRLRGRAAAPGEQGVHPGVGAGACPRTGC